MVGVLFLRDFVQRPKRDASDPLLISESILHSPINHAMDTVKVEKESAQRRYRRIRTIGRLFRCLEACAAILIVSWSSARLPAAAKLSVDILRSALVFVLSPRFVFLLGNAIVLVLFAKSGNLSPSPAPVGTGGAPAPAGDLYDEFLEPRGRICDPLPQPPAAEVVFEDKAVCVETKRGCRRTKSARMERRREAAELRRSETDVGRKVAESETEEDAEEFQRMVDAFIAKQLKFHRDESMAVVSSAAAKPPESVLNKYEYYLI